MELGIIFYIQCFITSLLETCIILVIVYGLIKKLQCTMLSAIYKCFILTLVNSIFTYMDSDHILYRVLPLLANIIFVYAITNKNFMHSIYLTIISYICILIIQFGIMTVFRFTAINQSSFEVQVFGNILTLTISWGIAHFIPINYVYNFIIRKDIAFRFLLGNTFVIVFFIHYLSITHLSHFIYYLFTIVIVVLLLVFVNVELLRSRIIMDKQNTIIDNYNKYLPIIDELIAQIRTRQHGYNNNLQAIRSLSLTCTDYESLKKELTKNTACMSDSDLPIFLLKFNLKLLSGIFLQKYSTAQRQGMHMVFTIKDYNIVSSVPEYIIVEAVGILMDNAIEACQKDDTIYVTVGCNNKKFHFDIMNLGPKATSEFCHNIFKRGYSTKASDGQSRGLGLYQLREISRKYNGKLNIENRTHDNQQYLFFSLDL